MTSAELFAAGYALPGLGMFHHYWLFKGETIKLPHGAVPMVSLPDVAFRVARIEDVRKANVQA